MPAQTIDNQILHSLPLLEMDQKKSLLSVIRSFLKNKETTPTRLTIEEYNKELEEAEARMDAGHFTTLEDAMKQAESW
ncbi:MAG: hypothetical protein K9G49_03305 [Taibaiella sp.]|nr:hypothetical protein [Taibaiella sp.]